MSNIIDLTLTWSDIGVHLLIAITAGLLVSFAFLYILLTFFRPKFKISKFICQSIEEYKDEHGVAKIRNKFSFKVVNTSKYNAFDISFRLFSMEPKTLVGASTNLVMIPLYLRTSSMTDIPRYRKNHHAKDPFASYACIFHTNEPIDKLIVQPGAFIELKLMARHGLTGLAEIFSMTYSGKDVLKCDHKIQLW